jgi:hypothetical protein
MGFDNTKAHGERVSLTIKNATLTLCPANS